MLVKTLFGFFLAGGEWVMWLLLVTSVICIGMMIERVIYFARARVDVFAVSSALRTHLLTRDLKAVRKVCDAAAGVPTRILLAGLEEAQHGVAAVEEAITASSLREKLLLERNLTFLGTVGSNAPFVGLFGTVLGIIKAFHDLSQGGSEGGAKVMYGISEALVATAVGLLVAIPAVIAFNYFQRQVKQIMADADTLARMLTARMKSLEVNAASGEIPAVPATAAVVRH